ncbi:hypothetical protein OH77DRAFT_1238918 [Trametes cingulata]|nr:hypothetical protein OH77DRAFT_1238918 [Trametes cingulata]
MDQNIDIPALFLPPHLRLGPTNWAEFRHAIETICTLHGVAQNLHHDKVWPPPFRGCPIPQEELNEREDWQRNDELCKAIITLNIRNFPGYRIPAGASTPASVVWEQLVKMHTKKRACWQVLTGRVRPLTGLERTLLVLLVGLIWLHVTIMSDMRFTPRRY